MVSLYNVPPKELIDKVANKLENEFELVKAPEWAVFVKTGIAKQCRPAQENWWFIRSAALLRSVAMRGPIGVNKLRKKYSSRMNRGHKPDKTMPASGNIIRKSLQQLEKSGLVKSVTEGAHKGKVLTPQGQSLLTKMSLEILKESKKSE